MPDKLKIAICFAGQYRTFDEEIVQKTLKHYLLDRYDCDCYFSTWDNRGCSFHGGDQSKTNDFISENDIKKYIPNCQVDVENYKSWLESISDDYKKFITFGGSHSGCVPQLYKKYKVVSMIPEDKFYDFVIVTRPDNFIFGDFHLENIFRTPDTIWNCNPVGKWPFYPNRIYDIMYMGNLSTIKSLSNSYFCMGNMLDDPYKSKLEALDCCKMLYIYAKKFCMFDVQSTDNLICDAYRGGNDIEYYLSHCNLSIENFKLKFNI
jgi:hypothetical protein